MINRCVCRNISFKEILSLLEGEKNLEEARKKVLFGDKCKMCLPYIQLAIDTKKTEFPELLF